MDDGKVGGRRPDMGVRKPWMALALPQFTCLANRRVEVLDASTEQASVM
jgi:hypothetical protein